MTACDLSSGYTVWEGSQQLATVIMEEFWRQGDEEKKQGLTPIEEIEPILDRTQKDSLPKLEVRPYLFFFQRLGGWEFFCATKHLYN